ncbi:NAD-P-binding protein [Gloeopeniophorella convolvens]|nr:NAD-P-binding protein [Gloeopeniophorella convolvens]
MPLVLVTGASGFIGSHVVDELLRTGYSVRGTVRSKNVARISKSYEEFGDKFTTAVVEDLAESDLTDAVTGVDAIIHVASPLALSTTPEVILRAAISGTTRILEFAEKAGVKQIIVTASIASLSRPEDLWVDRTISERDFCTVTEAEALQPNAPPFLVYSVSKTLAEQTLLAFARTHPDFDLTTIHPAYAYGPTGRGQVYDRPATGTNRYVYTLIAGPAGRPLFGYDPAQRGPPFNVDVRDVARAHVRALQLPKAPPGAPPKRFLVSSSTFTWADAAAHLAEVRPALKDRLPVVTGAEPPLPVFATLDTRATEEALGIKEYVKWQDTVVDTIDDMLRIERELAAKKTQA